MDLIDCCWTRHISRVPVAFYNEQLILACLKEKRVFVGLTTQFSGNYYSDKYCYKAYRGKQLISVQ